jgi:methylated-DNA-[protein]-cysteine S-methyltransferase
VLGNIGVAEENSYITDVFFGNKRCMNNFCINETPILKEAYKQLLEYLQGERITFELPIKPNGTEFQLKVWDSLQHIPFGQTKSYKEIAIEVNNPKACRAVGMANNKNPISIIIPCHRVIGSNRKLVGYAGGLKIKEYLLNLENAKVD